jgi:hypothetical protein
MSKHGFQFGSDVRSTMKPEWGPGRVIRVTGDTVQVVFRDYGTVSVKAAAIEPSDDMTDSFGRRIVDPVEFRKRVERLKRGMFETRIEGKPFAMRVTASGLEFTPGSGGARSVTWAHVDEVLAHYNVTGSVHPRDYSDLSRNASYILTLVDELFPDPADALEG